MDDLASFADDAGARPGGPGARSRDECRLDAGDGTGERRETSPGRARVRLRSLAGTEPIPGAVIVGMIALLVVVVSLPRFRAHVVRSNRDDVPRTLSLLGGTVFQDGWQSSFPDGRAPETLYGVVRGLEPLDHRFRDASPVEGSTELRHHGYLFDTGRLFGGDGAQTALVAWPVDYGRTGDRAFALTSSGGLFVHRNAGLWNGVTRPLVDVALSDEGWRRLATIPLPGPLQAPPR